MILFKKITAIKTRLELFKKQGKKIGFIPTMGALHQGHISLINLSRQQNDITVCSIFINPTQFNDAKDFEKYPVIIDRDILLLETNGANVLFLPSVHEIYPGGVSANPSPYPLGVIETMLEGQYRPGHFQGVCQVVHRLLKIIEPDVLYLGQKDYQQSMVIKKLIQIAKVPVKIIIAPTFREQNGLAMSSRNLRLSEQAKNKASAIHDALLYVKHNIGSKKIDELKKQAAEQLLQAGFEKIDYVQVAEAQTLQPAEAWDKSKNLVALVAAFIDGVRLIDNMLLPLTSGPSPQVEKGEVS